MNERVVEILIFIMNEIRKNGKGTPKFELLSRDLIKRGYTEGEISSAFSWILTRLRSEPEELVENSVPVFQGSFRILHEVERSVISPEAYGYIIQLRELGIIDDIDVEQILERAMMIGTSKVDAQDIKSIVATMLTNHEGLGEGPFLFYDDQPIIH